MKKLFVGAVVFYSMHVAAQETELYVAAKTGLNIREKPDVNAKVLDKIPYATKITLKDTGEEAKKINTEGLTGYWKKVTYNNKTGYIIDSYLFPFAPPKATVKTMKEYLDQLSAPFGAKLVVKSGDEETGSETHKQLYKNGGEWHEFHGYEYGSATYFIPGFTVQQGFLLVRMIAEFNEAIGEKDEFPVKDKTYKKENREYSIKIEKETITDVPWIKKISLEFESGVIYNFEMYQIDNQLVVFYGSGV
jgi:Bacterial SH3 domain